LLLLRRVLRIYNPNNSTSMGAKTTQKAIVFGSQVSLTPVPGLNVTITQQGSCFLLLAVRSRTATGPSHARPAPDYRIAGRGAAGACRSAYPKSIPGYPASPSSSGYPVCRGEPGSAIPKRQHATKHRWTQVTMITDMDRRKGIFLIKLI
jgi:hypothetical protein